MPVTRGAIKKLKQDKKRTKLNLLLKKKIKNVIKQYKRSPNKKLYSKAVSVLDVAKKKKLYHRNKVARIKSRLAKLLSIKKTSKKRKIMHRKKSS